MEIVGTTLHCTNSQNRPEFLVQELVTLTLAIRFLVLRHSFMLRGSSEHRAMVHRSPQPNTYILL